MKDYNRPAAATSYWKDQADKSEKSFNARFRKMVRDTTAKRNASVIADLKTLSLDDLATLVMELETDSTQYALVVAEVERRANG